MDKAGGARLSSESTKKLAIWKLPPTCRCGGTHQNLHISLAHHQLQPMHTFDDLSSFGHR